MKGWRPFRLHYVSLAATIGLSAGPTTKEPTMTTFARTNLSETVIFTPSDNSVQYDPGYGDPLITVTRVIVVYTMSADNECSSSVEVHGRRRLKSGDLSTVDKVYTHSAWENWRAWEQPQWLIRLVEDNRPGWWTTTD